MRSALILLLLALPVSAQNQSAPGNRKAESPPRAPETLPLEPVPETSAPLKPGDPVPSVSQAGEPQVPATGADSSPGLPSTPAAPDGTFPAAVPASAPPAPPVPKSASPTSAKRVGNSDALPPGPVPMIDLRPQDKTGRTYSDESPFVIWGGTREQRAQLFTTASLVRRAALEALHLGLAWNHNILIQIREPLAKGTDFRPPVWTSISQVPGGFRIEINLVPRMKSVPGPLLRENLVRATLADLILRGHDKDDLSGVDAPPPDWLLHGTLALMDYRQLGRMSTTFSTVFQLGRVLSISEILGADPQGMDSISMTIYRVSCCGLLMMLIEQPNGTEKMEKLLPSLALIGSDPSPAISRHYPALASSANGLSKWWTLQIAALSQPGLDEVQSPRETERLLAEALTLRYTIKEKEENKKPNALKRLFSKAKISAAAAAESADAKTATASGKKGEKSPAAGAAAPPPPPSAAPAAREETCDITSFEKVITLPDHEAILAKPDLDLTLLLLRAHPVYRPIITEYQAAVRNVAKGKKLRESAGIFERLAATRRQLMENMQGIENALDAWEASQSSEKSGVFDDYLRTAEEFNRPPVPRPDPISRYLDAVETEVGE